MDLVADIKEHLKTTYSESQITELIDAEVVSGNWVDADDIEENGCEDEHDYYREFGRGEAEGAVLEQIVKDTLDKFKINKDQYKILAGEELYETIVEMYPDLDDKF